MIFCARQEYVFPGLAIN